MVNDARVYFKSLHRNTDATALHLGRSNPMHQYTLRAELLESRGILVSSWMTGWPWANSALVAKKANGILRCI